MKIETLEKIWKLGQLRTVEKWENWAEKNELERSNLADPVVFGNYAMIHRGLEKAFVLT